MNKLIRGILVTVLLLAMVAGGVLAYNALTGTGNVTVDEALSFVGPTSFDVNVYPQEEVTAQLTIANASSIAMDVDLLSEVIPDPGAKGMTVDIPNSITVPGEGQIVVDITITAGKNAEPGLYEVSIIFDR